ncbi:MAG TPA: phospholipase D-like domain-containing protein [Longimicrobiales bacterium]
MKRPRRRRPRAARYRDGRPALGALLQRGLARAAEAPLVGGNAVAVLIDGPEVYPAMLERIAGAMRCVHLENYIFRADAAGRRFGAALAERARAGVQVRVLYDWLGSFRTAGSFWRELRAAGCDVRAFGPPTLRDPRAFFRRDHRKLLVVDGRTAVTGGLCIGDEWDDGEHVRCWRDTAIALEGPVCRELDRSFHRMWRLSGGVAALDEPPVRGAGTVVARVVDGPPAHARAYRLYQLIAATAEATLYVTGAYPLAPAPLRSALAAAARAGVDVRLLVPGRSDLPVLNQAARAHYAALLRAGIRIFEWSGPMLHAKTVVADGRIALVGSSNLNPFSLMGSYELDVEVQDTDVAGQLERQFLSDLGRAREITPDAWHRRPRAQRWRERLGAVALWMPYRLYSG